MSGEEIICGCGDHLTGCDYPVVGARCPTCAMLDRDEIEWLQKQCEMLTKERDALLTEVERLRRGVEAYQRMLWETTETPDSTERKMLYAEEMLAWEREDAERRESGDESRA